MSAFYKTTSSDYGSKWQVSNEKKPLATEIPTYSQLGQTLPQFRKTEKVLKNQLVAAKWGQKETDEEMDPLQAAKRKLDQNAIVAKKFPVQPGEYQIPQHGLKIGTPLYMTSYMDVGRLHPSEYEISDRYHPITTHFSKTFTGGMSRNASLNTANTNSKVHHNYDGNFGAFY